MSKECTGLWTKFASFINVSLILGSVGFVLDRAWRSGSLSSTLCANGMANVLGLVELVNIVMGKLFGHFYCFYLLFYLSLLAFALHKVLFRVNLTLLLTFI